MPTVHTQIESARGCGYRHKGKYLIGDKLNFACGMLPIELDRCPCCNAGIKFSRGFSWISKELIPAKDCSTKDRCISCSPWHDASVKQLGLLWVGEKFYPTTADFTKEAAMAGISKRIGALPKGVVLGETWIMLAHNKAIVDYSSGQPVFKKGIFAAFIPKAIEYVTDGTESDEELDRLEKQGCKLIRIIKDVDSQLPIDKQLDEWDVQYYKQGDRNKQSEIIMAHSEKAAKQAFKNKMGDVKTRIMSVDKIS